jgi:hypothetical protein
MRYLSSSRLSYRNVLIAAGLAAGLGVSSAYSKSPDAPAIQPQRDNPMPEGTVEASAGSEIQADHSQAR